VPGVQRCFSLPYIATIVRHPHEASGCVSPGQ